MENRQNNTRTLLEAALLSAIAAIFMLGNIYLPILTVVVIPIPIAIVYARHNFKTALMTVFVSFVLVLLLCNLISTLGQVLGIPITAWGQVLGNPITALGKAIASGLSGMTLGYCIKNKKSVVSTILWLTAALTLGYIIDSLMAILFLTPGGIQGFISDVNKFIDSYNQFATQSIERAKGFYLKMGIKQETLNELNEAVPKLSSTILLNLVPAVTVLWFFFSSIITFIITRSILVTFNYKVRENRPFSMLYLKNKVGALLIILFCLCLLAENWGVAAAGYIGSFLLIVGSVALVITGSSVAIYFLRRKFNIPKAIVILILVFTVIRFWTFFFTLGFIDMIIDFRKIDPDRIFKK